MLDGIINIKPDSDVVKRNKTNKYKSFLDRAYKNDYFGKDSIVFSPGAVYLSKLNWHLKDVNITSDDKFNFDFFIDDIEFITKVDLLNFYTNSVQNYRLVRKIENKEHSLKVFVELAVHKKTKLDDVKIKHISPSSLNMLFNRIFDMKINSHINKFDNLVIQNVANDLRDNIFEELDFVNNILYNFITKMDKFSFIKDFDFKYKSVSPVNIERILTFNAK